MNPRSPLLSPLLLVPGWIFEGILRVRNNLYSKGVFRRRRLPRPVISIGNITLGGTGKTPLVIYTADTLHELGCTIALLSRGYGRQDAHKSLIVMPGDEDALTARELGDEPALMRRRAPWMWLGISKDRHGVGRGLLERSHDLTFILDDGFQHRKLERTLDILVIDSSQPLSKDRVFPRGRLREPLTGVSRAQVIMLNLGSAPAAPAGLEPFLRSHGSSAHLLHCRQTIDLVVPFHFWKEGTHAMPSGHPQGKAFLVAAIGNPVRFRLDVEQAGIESCGSRYYRDHYRIRPQEWRSCAEEAQKRGARFMLTTEKDAIKTSEPPDFPLMVAVQSVCVEEKEVFRDLLRRAVGGAP